MRKMMLTVVLSLSLLLCGCAADSTEKQSSSTELSSVYEDAAEQSTAEEYSVIERSKEQEVSAPDNSIRFEEACELLDSCSRKSLYLPESAKHYQKYYFGTVRYHKNDFYSVYLYIENGEDRIYVGTNYLVSCKGKTVMRKSLMGDYNRIDTQTAALDETETKRYEGAKITPNEALAVLSEKNQTSAFLGRKLSDYTFDVGDKLEEIGSTECYKLIPSLDLIDKVEMSTPYYVDALGSGDIYAKNHKTGEYELLA